MPRLTLALVALPLWPLTSGLTPPVQSSSAMPTFAEPSISPDRAEIAFVSGGDIWTVPAQGGEARLLVAHAANDTRPVFSPDGSRLAFISSRTGNGDIYVLDLRRGTLLRVTYDDLPDLLDAWSRDGEWLYFSSTSRDIAGMHDVYRVRATGGTPMRVAGDRYASEFWSAPSPDGQTLALAARGLAVGQWWRKGRSHIDVSELHLVRLGATPAYTRVSDGLREAKEMWPMWAPDGRALYYVSDHGGAENLWTRPLGGGAPRRLTSFGDGRVLWPQIAPDGKAIVFERNFGVWLYDVDRGQARAVPITLRGAAAAPVTERVTLAGNLSGLALSPDGRKIAFVARGEIFAASARDGGEGTRVSTTPGPESHVVWLPDSRRIVYASSREGVSRLYLYDFVTRAESALTRDGNAVQPRVSPDGKWLAYTRNGNELRVLELATKRDHLAARGAFDRPPFVGTQDFAFSPDSRWLAFITPGARGFENAFVVPVEGGEPRQVSFLANAFGNGVVWSSDATFLLLVSAQRTESPQLTRVDLVPRAPRFREDAFTALFPGDSSGGRAGGAGGAPRDSARGRTVPPRTEIEFDGIRRRATVLPIQVTVQAAQIAPDGKNALITGSAAGQTNLFLWSLDELATGPNAGLRQLTTTSTGKGSAQWSPDGREIWYLEGGRVQVLNPESRQNRSIAVNMSMDVDFHVEKLEVFRQAWSYLRDNFYDERMHGADWNAVAQQVRPHVAGAQTPDEMRRILALMVGELNASHLGVSGPNPTPPHVGKLGVRFSRAEYERSGRFRIEELIADGPLARDAKVGDYLLAIDTTTLDASTNLDALLAHQTGRRIPVRLGAADGDNARTVAVRPISTQAEKNLLYQDWVESRRAYVHRVSGGRLGYVHIPDMGAGSLAQLYVDLDDENQSKEGVVIDIRNNNGGFVNAYALDVFARRPYLTMQPRGRQEYSARQQLGQRVFDRPTVLVTNQHSLSDAEDFTEGYRTLGLGKVVGEPTSGWIIYTSNVTLLDGTTVRLPFIRIRGADGKDMELVPRPVDVRVDRPIGEHYTGKDSQLDAAVRVLLDRP
ncbi:MAG TPA: S41 family peptidase [Gemmatimonadaceae bacterium]|nr:S41 family peptidase [Gemmatimonadaceae bacterium]